MIWLNNAIFGFMAIVFSLWLLIGLFLFIKFSLIDIRCRKKKHCTREDCKLRSHCKKAALTPKEITKILNLIEEK